VKAKTLEAFLLGVTAGVGIVSCVGIFKIRTLRSLVGNMGREKAGTKNQKEQNQLRRARLKDMASQIRKLMTSFNKGQRAQHKQRGAGDASPSLFMQVASDDFSGVFLLPVPRPLFERQRSSRSGSLLADGNPIRLHIIHGFHVAETDALRFPVTEITLKNLSINNAKVHGAEGANRHAGAAANAFVLIDHDPAGVPRPGMAFTGQMIMQGAS